MWFGFPCLLLGAVPGLCDHRSYDIVVCSAVFLNLNFRLEPVSSVSLYENHPVSRFRPLLRFRSSNVSIESSAPLLSIVTATQNPRAVFLRTAEFVLSQSLSSFEWIIVDDHSNDNVRSLD